MIRKDAELISPDEIPERLAFLTEGIKISDSAEDKTLVSIDVASPSQLGKTYDAGVPILSIDHHKVNTPYCDNCTLPEASSAGEVLFKVVKVLEKKGALRITKRIAERIYAAIASDTGGFIYSNAKEDTYRIAAELISCGIDHAEINRKLFNSKNPQQIKAEGYTALNMKNTAEGRISYFVL